MKCRWAFFVLMSLPALAGAADGLFLPDLASADRAAAAENGVLRARAVDADLRLLPGADGKSALPPVGHPVVLNLFDDVVLQAHMVRGTRLPQGLSWVGKLDGEPLGDVVLTVTDGILTGSVAWPGGAYRIMTRGGAVLVQEIDGSQFPEDDCFREVPGAAPEDPGDLAPAADSGDFVDVLVVYTPRARTQAGSTAAIVSLINTAVTETNTSYANSGVVQRLRLVGAQEVSYTETGTTSSAMSTDLSNLRGNLVSGVFALRESTKADLVSLIVDGYNVTGGACGIAYLMSGNNPAFASSAFSVVDRTCATGNYSFGHELGHNMGLNHARVDPVGTGAFSYSFGYKDPGNAFRTVMAYNCPVSCPRLLHFSNPAVSYAGKPTGIAEASADSAHNALSLNNTRTTVANWRVGATGVNGDATGDLKADLLLHQPGGTLSVLASSGSAFSSTGTWASGLDSGLFDVYFADVTGEGRADAIVRGRATGDVTVRGSTGTSFSLIAGTGPGGVWSYGWSSGYDLFFADVTGDGKADLVSRYYGPTAGLTGDVYIAASTGSGFSSPQRWTYGYSAGYDLYLADLSGDGRADLVSRYYGPTAALTGDVNVMVSTGTGLQWTGGGARWSYGWGSTYELLFRDVTGDGKADMTGRDIGNGNVFVASSTGSALTYLGTWATGVTASTRLR